MSHAPRQFIKTAGLNKLAEAPRARAGQSLVELLIATGVIVVLLGGTLTAVSVSLRSGRDNKQFQFASLMVQEALDNFAVLADSDWHRVDHFGSDAFLPSPAPYHVVTSAPFTLVSGAEGIVGSGITYSRYLAFDLVSRDASGAIDAIYSSSNDDPSTIKVTSGVNWGNGAHLEIMRYLTRSRSRVSLQSDWSGGSGQPGAFADPAKYDTSSAGIDVASKGGSIRLTGIAYP